MSHQPDRIYLFGPYRLNAAERLLRRDGVEEANLPNKALELVVYLKVWPIFEPLRADPRFSDLVRRIGIPL